MSWDWLQFLTRHRVHHVTRGHNVGPDEVNIKCPFCGDADPSEHMGISLSGRGWRCLRCDQKGKSRANLIEKILRCSREEARRLAGYDEPPAQTEDYSRRTTLLWTDRAPPPSPAPPRMPPAFRPLMDGGPMSEPFVRYMAGRGYGPAELEWIAREYDLRYATTGPFAWRVIIPIRDRRGALITWQGRAISPNEGAKYKTLSAQLDRASYGQVASRSSQRTLLGLPALHAARDARALIICEGAMDAIRLSLYGRALRVYATCLFGLGVSDDQVEELEELAGRFPRRWLCIDAREAATPSVRGPILRRLASVGARLLDLPPSAKDPGELPAGQAVGLCARAVGAD